MAIHRILAMEKDTDWHDIYRREFPKHFPGASVTCVDRWESALTAAREQPFDLYTTNYPRDRALLTERVAALRAIHPDARIALLTVRSRLDDLTETLGIGYFLKQRQDFLKSIGEYYSRLKEGE